MSNDFSCKLLQKVASSARKKFPKRASPHAQLSSEDADSEANRTSIELNQYNLEAPLDVKGLLQLPKIDSRKQVVIEVESKLKPYSTNAQSALAFRRERQRR